MKLSMLSGLLLFGFVGACTAAIDGGPTGADDRQPLGKADNIGSCQGPDDTDFCGGKSEGSCYCDYACVQAGDCCGDVSAVCEGDGVEPGQLCLSDDHCLDTQTCDHTECHSNCAPGQFCPAVCWGECVEEEPEPIDLCMSDDECGAGQSCDHTECHSNCAPGQFCPAVCWGECADDTTIPADCGDGTPGLCRALPPVCPDGTASFIVNHCWGPCVDPETCEAPVATCDEVVEEFMTETAEIRSCNLDADCGQVLSGTSCGCTRNWVARADADVEAWDELRQDVLDAGCDIPGGISTCDCPAADGFACEDNVCTWNYQ